VATKIPIIGTTESGKIVYQPTRGAPDTNNILTFRNTKDKFVGWSKADHIDAANLHELAAERAARDGNSRLASWNRRWSSVHWDIGGRWLGTDQEARQGRVHLL
jgi:hypothetical protein